MPFWLSKTTMLFCANGLLNREGQLYDKFKTSPESSPMFEAPDDQALGGKLPMGLVFNEIDQLACSDGGGGKYPHAGGANVDDGGVLTLLSLAFSPPVIEPMKGEQNWRVFGYSLARSLLTGCGHGARLLLSELRAFLRYLIRVPRCRSRTRCCDHTTPGRDSLGYIVRHCR